MCSCRLQGAALTVCALLGIREWGRMGRGVARAYLDWGGLTGALLETLRKRTSQQDGNGEAGHAAGVRAHRARVGGGGVRVLGQRTVVKTYVHQQLRSRAWVWPHREMDGCSVRVGQGRAYLTSSCWTREDKGGQGRTVRQGRTREDRWTREDKGGLTLLDPVAIAAAGHVEYVACCSYWRVSSKAVPL